MLLILPINLLFLLIVGLCAQDVLRQWLASRLGPAAPPAIQPLVSVIIPARNEAVGIGLCLAGLARQTYRAFEVLVVDDESTDGTAKVARSFADQLPTLAVLAGAPLPAGWAGKCWACWQAAEQATGEWLLFLDADLDVAPELISALIEQANQSRADLITLIPLLRLGTLAERLVLPAFQTILFGLYPLHQVSDPQLRLAFANGQCIFVRQSVYAAVGGHAAVRGSVLEDTDLGQRVKAAGYYLLAARAPDLLAVRMYTDWPSIVEGLGKNAVAGYRSGGARSAWVGARQSLLAFVPVYLLVGSLVWWLVQGGVLALALLAHGLVLLAITLGCAAWLVRARYRIGWWWGLLYPVGLALYFGIAGRALWRIWRGRGVVWKGRVLDGRP